MTPDAAGVAEEKEAMMNGPKKPELEQLVERHVANHEQRDYETMLVASSEARSFAPLQPVIALAVVLNGIRSVRSNAFEAGYHERGTVQVGSADRVCFPDGYTIDRLETEALREELALANIRLARLSDDGEIRRLKDDWQRREAKLLAVIANLCSASAAVCKSAGWPAAADSDGVFAVDAQAIADLGAAVEVAKQP